MTILLQSFEVTVDSPVGGKARSLASLAQARLPIPDWFVILPEAFERSIDDDGRRQLTAADGADDVAALIKDLRPSPEVAAEIDTAYQSLCPNGEAVAVRSSAADEDSAALSFAGQLESYLFVEAADLPGRVADVWRSGFTERIFSYRRNAGLEPAPTPPAVIVQRVVDGEISGVAFSADPISGRRGTAVVAAVWGLGQALVSGEADSDTWRVTQNGELTERKIVEKKSACRRNPAKPERLETVALSAELARKPALTDAQVAEVAELARDAERHFGRPQDIEWTWDGRRLYLLQSRPVTAIATKPDPDDTLRIWDNTNIIESYSGVTTPFTFSFIRRCYDQVYREFCRLMRVPNQVIEANSQVFAGLLGLLNGRVYYNIINGYRVLTLLPGYKLNRRFTEEMLGFSETLPVEVDAMLQQAAHGSKWLDLLRLTRTAWGMLINFATLERRIARFYERLHRIIPDRPVDLSAHSPDELVRLYRHLETELLKQWDAPTVNDFFAAIFHGTLRRLCNRWLGDDAGTLHNDLLCGDHKLISIEITERMRRMADLAAASNDMIAAMQNGVRAAIETELRSSAELEKEYHDYLDRFGDRCLDELKLESNTVRDDPLPLFRAIGGFAGHIAAGDAPESGVDVRILAAAEATVAKAIAAHPVRRLVFTWVLGQTRRRVRARENLRFERTRAFGMARRIAVEMGRRFSALDMLDDARDIFYLTLAEMLSADEGTSVTVELRELAALRRLEFERYAAMPPLPNRFETRGIPYIGDQFVTSAPVDRSEGVCRTGIGCCPGIVRGPVTIVDDPRGADIPPGHIVVAQRTDPGWVMVFPAASGLLVERGSMLSHSAIVAREMGLPTIVSIPGLTGWLSEGDEVELNGATGVVTRVGTGEEAE